MNCVEFEVIHSNLGLSCSNSCRWWPIFRSVLRRLFQVTFPRIVVPGLLYHSAIPWKLHVTSVNATILISSMTISLVWGAIFECPVVWLFWLTFCCWAAFRIPVQSLDVRRSTSTTFGLGMGKLRVNHEIQNHWCAGAQYFCRSNATHIDL